MLQDRLCRVLLDSTVLGAFQTSTTQAFTSHGLDFTATAGSHELVFRVVAGHPTGDHPALIEDVVVTHWR